MKDGMKKLLTEEVIKQINETYPEVGLRIAVYHFYIFLTLMGKILCLGFISYFFINYLTENAFYVKIDFDEWISGYVGILALLWSLKIIRS